MQRALPVALAALLGADFAAPALAQAPDEPGQGQPPLGNPAEAFIKQHDTDGDGKVSQVEAVAPHGARFKEMDANGDGVGTAEEFRLFYMAQVPPEAQQKLKDRGLDNLEERFIKELDQNGDGKVDQAESEQPTIDGFKRMDADGDGFATLDEVDAFFRKMWEEVRRMHEEQRGQPPAQ